MAKYWFIVRRESVAAPPYVLLISCTPPRWGSRQPLSTSNLAAVSYPRIWTSCDSWRITKKKSNPTMGLWIPQCLIPRWTVQWTLRPMRRLAVPVQGYSPIAALVSPRDKCSGAELLTLRSAPHFHHQIPHFFLQVSSFLSLSHSPPPVSNPSFSSVVIQPKCFLVVDVVWCIFSY